jgi:hypothetical protein
MGPSNTITKPELKEMVAMSQAIIVRSGGKRDAAA